MNNQEAINELMDYIAENDKTTISIETVRIAIEALEKQIPKKVIIESWNPAICPTCGEELSEDLGDGYYEHYYYLERCSNAECAQRLLW